MEQSSPIFTKSLIRDRMKEAFKEAEKSPCLKKKVGAVFVGEFTGTTLSKGHGGVQKPYSCEVCVRKTYTWQQDGCWSIHSEMNALFHYFKQYGFHDRLQSVCCFVTHGPCDQCLKYLRRFGVMNVFYSIPYKTDYSKWKDMNIVEIPFEELNIHDPNSAD